VALSLRPILYFISFHYVYFPLPLFPRGDRACPAAPETGLGVVCMSIHFHSCLIGMDEVKGSPWRCVRLISCFPNVLLFFPSQMLWARAAPGRRGAPRPRPRTRLRRRRPPRAPPPTPPATSWTPTWRTLSASPRARPTPVRSAIRLFRGSATLRNTSRWTSLSSFSKCKFH